MDHAALGHDFLELAGAQSAQERIRFRVRVPGIKLALAALDLAVGDIKVEVPVVVKVGEGKAKTGQRQAGSTGTFRRHQVGEISVGIDPEPVALAFKMADKQVEPSPL